MHRFHFKVFQAKSISSTGHWELGLGNTYNNNKGQQSSKLWCWASKKKRKLVKMRGILKKKVAKRNSSNSYTVRRKCLTVNTAAVHIPIKVSNKVKGSWWCVQMREIKETKTHQLVNSGKVDIKYNKSSRWGMNSKRIKINMNSFFKPSRRIKPSRKSVAQTGDEDV